MASEKKLNTRIIQKHDTSINWSKAKNFTPEKGEIIIYDDLHKIKIGDGITLVNSLPFIHNDWSEINNKPSTFSPSSHTHTKSQVGLGNVDNTADANKSVKYATTAGSTPFSGITGLENYILILDGGKCKF